MNKELMFSSKSDQHYTPVSLLNKVTDFFLGTIDLDPCSNSFANPHTPARIHYTQEIDGLIQPWIGRVFVNPPYSDIQPFLSKAKAEFRDGNAKEILILVPARTDTQWHYSMRNFSRCYITGRLKFVNPENKGRSAPFPSMLFYLGYRVEKFCDFWESTGECFVPKGVQL